MKKVYIIGGGNIDLTRIAAHIPNSDNCELVRINSVDDIPLEERNDLNVSKFSLKELSLKPSVPEIYWEDSNKKVKGHERPYKFHR